MKLSGAKLKNVNYKQLLIDHGEKAILAMIGLFVLVALVRTNWARYDRTPEEMSQLAKEADEQIEANEWPEADQTKVVTNDDLLDKVEQVHSKVDVEPYSWSIPFGFSLYSRQMPIEEPDWLPVEQLEAGYGRVLLAMTPEKTEQQPREQLVQNDPAKEPGSQIPKEFQKSRTGIGGGGSKQRLLQGLGAGGIPGDEDVEEARRERQSQQRRRRRSGHRRGDDDDKRYGMERLGMGIGRRASFAEARGFRFVSVRGIFPLAKQLREIQRARHEDDFANVEGAVEIRDFELQRQRAVAGDDPWAGEWEPVDIQDAQDVLDAVVGWDADVVDSGITDLVFTMPLPMRGFGIWSWEATHPGVESYELSPEEIEEQIKFDRELIQRNRTQQRKKEEEQVKWGGFARQQEDLRELHLNLSTRQDQSKELQQIYAKIDPNLREEELKERLRERIQRRKASPLGRLLLFRYLDFGVEPGNTYRYRVRVMLKNPNSNVPPELAASPEVVERETRWTEWSEPTDPVFVPYDAKYFLAKINETSRQTNAVIDLFQWFPDTGTFVNKSINARLGEPIGGTESAYVLNPIDELFEEEDVEFSTNAVLVDLEPSPEIRRLDHPDLQLNGRQPVNIGVPDRAVFANEYGELEVSDPKTDHAEYSETVNRQHYQDMQFEEIRGKLKQMADDSGTRLFLDGEPEELTGSAALRQKMREMNNSRRRRGRGDDEGRHGD